MAFSWLYLQALKIIWLPVLTTIPQSQELSREFQQLNNNISSLPLGSGGGSKFRGVRNLNILPKLEASPRALCSHCRYDILHLGPEWVRRFYDNSKFSDWPKVSYGWFKKYALTKTLLHVLITTKLSENTLYLLGSDRINFIFIVRSKTLLRLIK